MSDNNQTGESKSADIAIERVLENILDFKTDENLVSSQEADGAKAIASDKFPSIHDVEVDKSISVSKHLESINKYNTEHQQPTLVTNSDSNVYVELSLQSTPPIIDSTSNKLDEQVKQSVKPPLEEEQLLSNKNAAVENRSLENKVTFGQKELLETTLEGEEKFKKFKHEIEQNNRLISDLKRKIYAISKKSARTESENSEHDFLHRKLEAEIAKVKCKIDQCMARESWGQMALEELSLPTTLEEDEIPKLIFCPRMSVSKVNTSVANSSLQLEGKLLEENMSLERKIESKDQMVECLQQKVQSLEAEMCCMLQDNERLAKKLCGQVNSCGDVDAKLLYYKQNIDMLEKHLNQMTLTLQRLETELVAVQNEKNELQKSKDLCALTKDPDADIRRQYGIVLQEFSRKDAECQKLKKQFCKQSDTSPEPFKNRLNRLLKEQEQYQIIISEQAEQLDEYRNKFLRAQQIVEEQKCQIANTEMNNQHIEDQINMEITRIKTKFQEKLKDLTPYPKLLENEQIKLQNSVKQNEILEKKFRSVCQALESAEHKLEIESQKTNIHHNGPDNKLLQKQLEEANERLEQSRVDKGLLNEQLQATLQEMDLLRAESANIIAGTKERADTNKDILRKHINKIEMELAQCRAVAVSTLREREEAMGQMQKQMNLLAENFQDAQMQIKSFHFINAANQNI